MWLESPRDSLNIHYRLEETCWDLLIVLGVHQAASMVLIRAARTVLQIRFVVHLMGKHNVSAGNNLIHIANRVTEASPTAVVPKVSLRLCGYSRCSVWSSPICVTGTMRATPIVERLTNSAT